MLTPPSSGPDGSTEPEGVCPSAPARHLSRNVPPAGQNAQDEAWVVGVIDLGSNSVRLMLVRVRPDGTTTTLNQVKHMIRLGAGAFVHNRLREDAMDRAMGVLRGLADMCALYGARDVVAIATAAVRDSDNGAEFLRRVKERTGLEFTAISGREEARLIYLGVSSGLEPTDHLRLFIDIGGGSTELAVADSHAFNHLESLRLGCVRLTNQFFHNDDGPVSPARYTALQRHIRREGLHAFQRLAAFDIVEAVASSGTAQNLAEVAAAMVGEAASRARLSRQSLSYDGLRRAVKELCARDLASRRSMPGINPDRADVIVAGAAILQTIMEEQGFESVRISGRSLQHGILADYLLRQGLAPAGSATAGGSSGSSRPDTDPASPEAESLPAPRSHAPTRKNSVLQLARLCRFEEEHARHVSALALELFDSSAALGLHPGYPALRELLQYAALLHDIGIFLSFSGHHRHAHYLVRNTELLGFTAREIELMAATAFFHRKRPSRRYEEYSGLDKEDRKTVRLLSLFLTLAERMDKSHRSTVRSARFARAGDVQPGTSNAKKRAGLELRLELADDGCAMELDEVERARKFIRREFGEEAAVKVEGMGEAVRDKDEHCRSDGRSAWRQSF